MTEKTIVGRDEIAGNGGNGGNPSLSVALKTPSSGLSVSGAQPGVALELTGTYRAVDVSDVEIWVDVGGRSFPATLGGTVTATTWRATVRFYAPGPIAATAHGSATSDVDSDSLSTHSNTLTFTVTLASSAPILAIEVPAANANIPVSEGGDLVALRAITSDQFGPRTVSWECEGRSGPATQNAAAPTTWDGQVVLTGLPLGSRTITVRCRDVAPNEAVMSVAVTAVDVTPPELRIAAPTPFQTFIGAASGVTVPAQGTARDGQSGMAGGRVEWSLTGGPPFTAATTSDNWATWSASIPITDYGTFTIDFRAVDKAGRERTIRVPVQVVSAYRPRDLDERLDHRSYLEALLAFGREQVRLSGGGQLSSAELQMVFGQPFGKLSQPLSEIGEVGNLSVNQLQLVAEVLREYRRTAPALLVGHWTFDQATLTGTQIADQSGTNPATLVGGAALDPGLADGQAVRFDGTSRYAEIAHSPSLELGRDDGDFSVSFFIQPKQGATGRWRVIAHKGNTDTERTFAIWLHPSDTRLHARISTTEDGNEGLDSATQVAVDRWTHVAYVKAGNELRLYLDGKLDQSVSLQGRSVSNDGPIYLGKDPVHDGFDGLLDELRIYTFALTERSVQALAAGPAATSLAALLASGEAAYRWAAYEAFLAGIGTSFEELRLARGADAAARTSLGARIGIRLSPTAPDELTQLTREPSALTEALLEELFGLRDSDVSRGILRQPVRPLLLQWRETALALRWAEADHGTEAAERAFPVLVEPDLLAATDLVTTAVNNPAQSLLSARRNEVQTIRADLRRAREAAASPADGLRAILGIALPGIDLTALKTAETTGKDIGPALRAALLSREAFAFLLRMTRIVATGTVTEGEWQDTYDILTQVQKARRYAQWRQQESGLVLGPELFQLSDAPVMLPRWRATRQARNAWLALLQARIDERAALRDSYQALVASVEEATLPLLRDALVAAWAGKQAADDAAEWLSARLQLDVQAGGRLRTTRVLQATETLQSLLFLLRTGQLPEGHPADDWTLTVESVFDVAWRWLGSYEAWTAAMLVFLYPENLLLPALRPDATQPFAALVRDLRQRQRLTPEDARTLASAYLAAELSLLHQGRLPAPVAYWPLEEGSGGSAGDASGGGSMGTLSGPAWTIGPIGRALAFDGLDDRVVIAPSQALKNLTNTFAIAFWARPASPHEIDPESTRGVAGMSGQRYAFGPLQGQVTFGDKHAGIGVSVGTNGISVYEHSADYLPSVLTHEAPLTGWTHVIVMYEDRKPRLFVNGKLVCARDTQSPMTSVHPCPDGLGGMGYGFFHGQLDDLRIYAGSLSQEQVELLAFRLTDERTDAQLDDLRALSSRLLAPERGSGGPPYFRTGSAWLTELFAFVPLALALQLQASGEYLAALDWYQTVFAYNLPPGRRKIYYGLALERNVPTDLAPTGDWTSRLNPHTIAATRPNPYTRFVLTSIARSCSDFGDAEFTQDTSESRARARSLYATARDLLSLPDLQPVLDTDATEWPLPNPLHAAMRARTEMQLEKLRQGRNIAGIERALEIPATIALSSPLATQGAISPDGAAPAPSQLRPTPHRYRALIDRTKQLVALAEQVEAAYLSALEKYDAAAYRRFEANKGLELADAGVVLQGLRLTEASRGVSLAQAQRARADAVSSEYQQLIDAGLNEAEQKMLDGYRQIRDWRNVIGGIEAAIGVAQMAVQAGDWLKLITSFGATQLASAVATAGIIAKAGAGAVLNDAEAGLQANTLLASHERVLEGWRLQRNLARQDALVADAGILVAKDQQAIVSQEERIAETQAAQAKATVEFLDRQFTNQELYEWMSGVLAGVYRYFLQQATALARMAQDQLAFERAEAPAGLIRADYWEPPTQGLASGVPSNTPDRRGLTGSTRLLQDIYQLDQYAFESDKRKLNLSQTFSLAERAPLQFQLFRESGALQFATPMDWFDEGFPGHYLRLIRRVSVSVVALIPPGRGIRATLTSSGISRVIVGGDSFHQVIVRRDPELVALTSPLSATGVFELDTQSEMLLPFEATGVDTSWELQLPPAANPFDFRSIGDVLLTIEYTALASDDYRRQVLERLNRVTRRTADRAFSLRQDFPDEWYYLHNPDSARPERSVKIEIGEADFPSNLDSVAVDEVVLYLVPANGAPVPNVGVTLRHAGAGGAATSERGLISTRRGNAASWAGIRTKPAVGAWDLTFSAEAAALFDREQVDDLLLVIGYGGIGPSWPT
jgi:Tc toxin complex TcA C-terminal TcB-binding domain/Concanavalin A-like lectin/glucanases superfamily/ABC toxin N-terminal region